MLDRILIATDGSEHSGRGVALGAAIAAGCNAEVALIHAVVESPSEHELTGMAKALHDLGPQPVAPLHMDDLGRLLGQRPAIREAASHAELLRQYGQEILHRAAASVREHGAEVAKTDLRMGKPEGAILAAASDYRVDLIVLGTRGLGAVRRAVMGSVSGHVSAHAGVSCLTVR